MNSWNAIEDPISSRLRDNDEIKLITKNKHLIYHEKTNQTGLIVEVYIVDDEEDFVESTKEDRYVQYIINEQYKEDWSIDLDDEGWIWFDELKEIK